jgi:hypothetical protein
MCLLVAHKTKILVPHLGERGDQVLHFATADGDAGMDDISPGVYRGAFRALLKGDPLSQRYAKRMVDPSDSFLRGTAGDYMVDDGVHRVQQLDLHAAAWPPRLPFSPSDLAIDIGEVIPSTPIGKKGPSQFGAGFRRDTVVKTYHSLVLPLSFSLKCPHIEGILNSVSYTMFL